MPVGADEDVLGLEVAVDDACGVEAFNALDDLCGVEPRTVPPETSPSGKLGGEISTRMEVLLRVNQTNDDGILEYAP